MTVGEWKKQNPNTGYSKVWAEDAPTFGRKGWMACGNCDDCEIVEIKQAPWGAPELHIKLIHRLIASPILSNYPRLLPP